MVASSCGGNQVELSSTVHKLAGGENETEEYLWEIFDRTILGRGEVLW